MKANARQGRPGLAVSFVGRIWQKDGTLYIDERPLVDMLGNFLGRTVDIEVYRQEVEPLIDRGIHELVLAISEKGYKTLSSCEGHYGKVWPQTGEKLNYAYVSFYASEHGADRIKSLDSRWTLERISPMTYTWRTRFEIHKLEDTLALEVLVADTVKKVRERL